MNTYSVFEQTAYSMAFRKIVNVDFGFRFKDYSSTNAMNISFEINF